MNKIVYTSTYHNRIFTFQDIDLINGTMKDVLNNALISETLSIDTASFVLQGREHSDIEPLLDSNGEQLYDSNNDPLYVYVLGYQGVDFSKFTYGDEIDYYVDNALYGKYYLSDVSVAGDGSGEITFMMESLMGILDGTDHVGGIYSGAKAGDIIAEIMDGYPYSIDGVLSNILLYGWLPYDTKLANLTQVLFACGASVLKDANGDLEFTFNLPQTATQFTTDEVYLGGARRDISPATVVKVTEHTFLASNGSAETLFDNTGDTPAVDYEIRFDDPYHTLAWTGDTIIAGANYAILNGNGVLTGVPYVHVQRVKNKSTGVQGKPNEKSAANCTLISTLNSDAVLDRLANYYTQSQEIDVSIVANDERPGSLIQIPDPADIDNPILGYIKTMKRTYSSKLKAECVLTAGWVPGDIGNSYDSYLIVRKSDIVGGTWSVPAELQGKQVLIVLFGGGQGGQGGWYGAGGYDHDGGSYNDSNAYICKTYRLSEAPIMGGVSSYKSGQEGGNGGLGGNIGKMFMFNIGSLAASYSVALGTGGAGGTGGTTSRSISANNRITLTQVDPTDGSYGTDSTFDTYSTASGILINAEYVNIITGTIIAGRGESGTKGGRGGDGGVSIAGLKDNNSTYDYSVAGRGKKGEDVSTYTGGTPADGLTGGDLRGYFNPGYDHVGLQGGGGGGGAAMGSNGGNGSNNAARQQFTQDGETVMAMGRTYNGTIYTASQGGNGASASLIPAQSDLYGGTGGHGGGGGGGNGQAIGYARWSDTVYGVAYEGIGGNGANGGQGSDGWFIVYYKA